MTVLEMRVEITAQQKRNMILDGILGMGLPEMRWHVDPGPESLLVAKLIGVLSGVESGEGAYDAIAEYAEALGLCFYEEEASSFQVAGARGCYRGVRIDVWAPVYAAAEVEVAA